MAQDIKFRNATHGWALSQNKSSLGHGIILYTGDGGKSWRLQLYNYTMWFHQIEFVGRSIWVTAEGGLLYSHTDGQTWTFLPVGTEYDYFGSVHFYNDTLGWAGSNRGVYRTDDGGTTWHILTTWTFDDSPRRIFFTAPSNGWIIGTYGIYHSSDGGESWIVRLHKGGWDFTFISATEAWAVGDNMLAHMVDGVNWIEQSLPTNEYGRPPYIGDVLFKNKTHGWIGALNPQIAHTQNGGVDWYEQSVSGDEAIIALNFYNESLGWAIGWDGRIYRTSQANKLGEYSWSTVNVTLVYGVSFVLIALVVISIVFARFRKRPPVTPSSPAIEQSLGFPTVHL